MSITITGLTVRQKQLMDLLWSCKTLEQVETLVQALPTKQDRVDCSSLVKIAQWETIEQELGLAEYEAAAQAAIASARC